MASTDPLVSRILPFLQPHEPHTITQEYTGQEVAEHLYTKSEQRLDILKHLISHFSEQYRKDLEDTDNFKWELVRQIHSLQFTEASNKISFVMGDCPIKEQKKIFEKIITALEYMQLAEGSDSISTLENNGISPDTDRMAQLSKEQGSKNNKTKHFDLEEYVENLEKATKLIEKYKRYLQKPNKKEIVMTQYTDKPLRDTEVEETCNAVKDLSNTLSRLPLLEVPEYQLEPSSKMSKLNCILNESKQVIHNSGCDDLEPEIINSRIYLEGISKFKSNSKILNLKNDKNSIIL